MTQIIFSTQGRMTHSKKIGNRLMVAGIILVLLGIGAMFAAFSATMATVFLFGVLLFIAGLVQLGHAFSDRSHGFIWRLLVGALYSLVGFWVMIDPVGGAVSLTLLIALFFIGGGILRLTLSYSSRRSGLPANWQLTGGLMNMILAFLILAGWPESGTWVIGLFLGIEFLFAGIILLFTAAAVR